MELVRSDAHRVKGSQVCREAPAYTDASLDDTFGPGGAQNDIVINGVARTKITNLSVKWCRKFDRIRFKRVEPVGGLGALMQ